MALPEQLFYNTGISTYVWVLTNRKDAARRGKVQLVDASSFWHPMKKSLGQKRRELGPAEIRRIVEIVDGFAEGEHSHLYPTTFFGYRKITVERPLRLSFRASPDRIARLDGEKAFQSLATSKKKDARARAKEEAAGREEQKAIRAMLSSLREEPFAERGAFEKAVRDGRTRHRDPFGDRHRQSLSPRSGKGVACDGQ